jgi:hypothetical protein
MTVDEMLERAFDLRGTPPNTRRTYTYCVHHFERFVGGPITELGRQQVEQFLLHLVMDDNYFCRPTTTTFAGRSPY